MSLFDCNFLSPSSLQNPFSEHSPYSFEYRCEVNQNLDSADDSTGSFCLQENSSTSPSSIIPKNAERSFQRGIFKGPDVFGKVLGPTADESILVGLQALFDVAGTLDFATFTPSGTSNEQAECSRRFCCSKDTSNIPVVVMQSSVSCQCFTDDLRVDNAVIEEEELNPVRPPQCQYIVRHENMAAAVTPRRNRICQHSQTRVLPKSMTCYNPEKADFHDRNTNMVPCQNTDTKKFTIPCKMTNKHASARPITKNARSPSPSISPTNVCCSCSKFYHQTTTISVLENSPRESPTSIPCQNKRFLKPVNRPSSPICPGICDAHVATELPSVEKKSVSINCEPCHKNVSNTSIQTLPQRRPELRNVDVETDSLTTSRGPSVACDCNSCSPISTGESSSPSTVLDPPVGVGGGRVRFADEKRSERDRQCSAACGNTSEKNNSSKKKNKRECSVRRNKSCSCCLIRKGVVVADATCSCLKVNTSCQYYKTEYIPIESKSIQCETSNTPLLSSTQFCSECGDFRTQQKKSVRILSAPYEYSDSSEAKYCIDPERIFSTSMDFSDDYSKFCLDRNANVRQEMGDSCVPPPLEIRYAITKITKFRDFSTFEVMKSTSKKPKCMPKSVEGVFVLKKEEVL